MLLTYCLDDAGEERLYLLPKGSIDVWLAPDGPGGAWTYHWQQADTDGSLDFARTKAEPVRTELLARLAKLMHVPESKLATVPFNAIAAHAVPPRDSRDRRVPTHRQRGARQAGFQTRIAPRR